MRRYRYTRRSPNSVGNVTNQKQFYECVSERSGLNDFKIGVKEFVHDSQKKVKVLKMAPK